MIELLALTIVATSMLLAVVAAVRCKQLTAGIPMMLDLWIAAGLLRLTHTSSWSAIASAAALIVIRRFVARALL